MIEWNPADVPPEGVPGLWTEDVVVVTNLRNVYRIAYFTPEREEQGVWQRPKAFVSGEVVKWWTKLPSD